MRFVGPDAAGLISLAKRKADGTQPYPGAAVASEGRPDLAGLLMKQHFIFTNLVAPAEIPKLAGIMDVLVHLSLREGLARALPMALAAGKPVIAYDCDGANEVCLENETECHRYCCVLPGHSYRPKSTEQNSSRLMFA